GRMRVGCAVAVGSAIAVGLVGAALVADAGAMVGTPGWASVNTAGAGVIVSLVGGAPLDAFGAAVPLQRAVAALRNPKSVDFDTTTEPDVVDDALDLAVEVVDRAHLRRVR